MMKGQRIRDVSGTLSDSLYQLIRNRDPVLGFLNSPEKYENLFRDLYP